MRGRRPTPRLRRAPLTTQASLLLPAPPDDAEMLQYVRRHQLLLNVIGFVSFACVIASTTRFALAAPTHLAFFFGVAAFSVVYLVVTLVATVPARDFDMAAHRELVSGWHPAACPSVDVFLPICGEPLAVLANTWRHVAGLVYPGRVRVYCLDDGGRPELRSMADAFGFTYLSRPDRGVCKKAGNLRFGFANSAGDVVAVFDADFCPRADFLTELMPYLDDDPTLGIVQSPQYFAVHRGQNWLERGAGAVQELFYRLVQTARQSKGGAICVGSNAIYRREALEASGGFAPVEHSEDVHTGVRLRAHGWHLRYVPVILATGLCPADLRSFFAQQYRWCSGSMTLVTSRSFWAVPLGWRVKVCYLSGCLYYLHTALLLLAAPTIPIVALVFFQNQIRPSNFALLVPAVLYSLLVLPLWHRSAYRLEVWPVMMVYSWAHLLAIVDTVLRRRMAWRPTGANAAAASSHYRAFTSGVAIWGGGTAVLWVGFAAHAFVSTHRLGLVPMTALGIFYLVNVWRVLRTAVQPEIHEDGEVVV